MDGHDHATALVEVTHKMKPPEFDPASYREFEAVMDSIEGTGPQTTLFDLLVEDGVDLPDPDNVTDAELSIVLWAVIAGMAAQGAYLRSTNHLSDRELYSELWKKTLREEHPIVPEDWNFTTEIDLLGGWSNEDTQTFLTFYANEEERKRFADLGSVPLPDHADPPYSRDHLLPHA